MNGVVTPAVDPDPADDRPIRRTPSITHDVYDDEVLIHDHESGLAVSLSISAGLIWAQCDGISTADDIAAALIAAYPEAAEEIRRDVPLVISELTSIGVIEVS